MTFGKNGPLYTIFTCVPSNYCCSNRKNKKKKEASWLVDEAKYTYTIKYIYSNIIECIICSLLFIERDKKQEHNWLVQNNDSDIRCDSKLLPYEDHPRFFSMFIYLFCGKKQLLLCIQVGRNLFISKLWVANMQLILFFKLFLHSETHKRW